MHLSQLTRDGTLAGGLNFAGEWRHPTLSPRGSSTGHEKMDN